METVEVIRHDFERYPYRLTYKLAMEHLDTLHVEVMRCAEYICTPKWNLEPRTIGHHVFFFINGGSGSYQIGTETGTYAKDHLLSVAENVSHAMTTDPADPLRTTVLHFRATLMRGVSYFDLVRFPVRLDTSEWPATADTFEKIAAEFDSKEIGWRGNIHAVGHFLLVELLRRFGAHVRPRETVQDVNKYSRLAPALAIINERFATKITVSELARSACLSEVQFRKIFKHAVGLSPARYVQFYRLREAASMLRRSSQPVKTIAYECGFRDLSFFHRAFKRFYGLTSGEYRDTGAGRVDSASI